jgi:hypothetical protein
MAGAGTTREEIDQSTRIDAVGGEKYAGIVIPLSFGRTDKEFFCSTKSDFLQRCTPNGVVEIGMDIGIYSALLHLSKANGIYVKRAHNRAMFGGGIVKSGTAALTESLSAEFVYSGAGNIFTIAATPGAKLSTGITATVSSDDTLPAGLSGSTTYYVIKMTGTTFKLASSLANAIAGTAVTISDVGDGTHTIIANVLLSNLLTVTFTCDWVASTNEVDTQTIATADGKNLSTGQAVQLRTTGTLPTGFTKATTYYLVKISNTSIKFATTYANATATTPVVIDVTGAGTGTHTLVTLTNHSIPLTSTCTIDSVENTVTLSTQLGSITQSGDEVSFSTDGSLSGSGITAATTYYAVRVDNETIKLATTRAHAIASTPTVITITGAGTGVHTITKSEGALSFSSYSFADNESLLFYQANPGSWALPSNSGSVKWTVEDYRDKEDDAFIVNVFKLSDLVNPVETWYCSRKKKKDGYFRNMYVEDVLLGSKYIRAIDNLSIADTVFPIMNYTPTNLVGGDDGDPVTDSIMITAAQASFNDPDNVNIYTLMDAGWSTKNYHQAIEVIAKNRGDCLALGCVPISEELKSDYMGAIVEYRETLNINSSYMSLYSCHQKILDTDNDREIYVGLDGFASGIICSNSPSWLPPAGWKRGSIQVIDPLIKFDGTQRGLLYDKGVNPSRYKKLKGVAIWGQKTLQTRASALDRNNVRLMLAVVEPAIQLAMDDFVFEYNDEDTRQQLHDITDDYMSGVKREKGVYDYYVVCDETNNTPSDIDNHKMTLWVFAKPTITGEFLKLGMIITRTGDDFSKSIQLLQG